MTAMSIRVSSHTRQRLKERTGTLMSDQEILDLIPGLDQARIARAEKVLVRVPHLKVDLACEDGVIITALNSHRHNRAGGPMRRPIGWRPERTARRPEGARTQQTRFDVDEDVVVGGRLRRAPYSRRESTRADMR